MSTDPPNELTDDLFIEHFEHMSEPFLAAMPKHDSVQLRVRATWYNSKDHEYVLELKAHTSKFSAGVWMFTNCNL